MSHVFSLATATVESPALEAPAQPTETERWARLVERVRADATAEPEHYLQETVVPEGGE